MVFVELNGAARAAAGAAVLATLLLAGGDASSSPSPPLAALPLDRLFPGDLVFRAGRGVRADLVRVAGDGPWSHVGLLDRGPAGGWVVIHAAPPEAGGAGGVTETPLGEFASPAYSSALSVYRVAGLDARSRALVTARAHRLAQAGVPFDESLDLASPDALYCTELVVRLFAGAGADLGIEPSSVSVGGLTVPVLMPHDLMAAPRLRRVF